MLVFTPVYALAAYWLFVRYPVELDAAVETLWSLSAWQWHGLSLAFAFWVVLMYLVCARYDRAFKSRSYTQY